MIYGSLWRVLGFAYGANLTGFVEQIRRARRGGRDWFRMGFIAFILNTA